MKKNETATIAKKARKAFKQELTEKIISQLKIAVGAVGTDLKKTNKAIEKAAKNLAKKISKQAVSKKVSKVSTTIKTDVKAKPVAQAADIKALPATEKAALPAKAKTPATKKSAAKPE